MKISNHQPKKWSRTLTRGSNYSDLTWEIFVFWKSGRLRDLVAQEGSRLREVVAQRGSTVFNSISD